MDISTLMTILMDVALGGMAYRLAKSLEKTVKLLAEGHEDLAKRVELIEKRLP